MAIKMRTNKNPKAKCCECKSTQTTSLDMYDVCIGGQVFTLCDKCTNDVLTKTLKATCLTQARIKSKEDINIIRRRNQSSQLLSNTKHLSINEALK